MIQDLLIAVIDDDDALCSSLVDLLRSAGYLAEPFASAEMFLASRHSFNLGCIIADVHMPGMGGLDLLRRLRDQNIAIPVVLVTALADEQLDDAAIAAGAFFFLRKPFRGSSMLDCVGWSLMRAVPC